MGQLFNYSISKFLIAGLCSACFFLLCSNEVSAQNDSDSTSTDSIPRITMPGGKGGGNDTVFHPNQPNHAIENPVVTEKDPNNGNDKGNDKKNKEKSPADTARIKLHNPKTAAWMSAVLPGLGQIYNKKYWKLSIVYVGLGVCTYFAWTETVQYRKYRETYRFRMAVDPAATDWFPNETDNTVKEMKEYHHRNLEISYIAGSLIYLLNIVDATVDAHLYGFDVSDDLTMRIEPAIQPSIGPVAGFAATGITIKLKF